LRIDRREVDGISLDLQRAAELLKSRVGGQARNVLKQHRTRSNTLNESKKFEDQIIPRILHSFGLSARTQGRVALTRRASRQECELALL
jgi:hypothetical protein